MGTCCLRLDEQYKLISDQKYRMNSARGGIEGIQRTTTKPTSFIGGFFKQTAVKSNAFQRQNALCTPSKCDSTTLTGDKSSYKRHNNER